MGLGTNLFETSYNSPFKFGDMSIQSISADACNPELCNRSIPCVMPHMKSIDSLAIFRADGQTILNANDAMSIASVLTISKFVDKVDLVLGHYGAASPFPQCFPDLRANDQLKDELVNGSIDNLICLAETVKAKYLFPFAGQYILGGKLTHLNSYRAVIESDEAVRRIRARGSSVTPFSLKVGAKFDLDNEEVEAEYLEPSKNEINDYVAVISKSKFPYENIKLERILADKEFLEGTTLRQASARVLRLANLTPKAWGVSYFIKTPHISFALNLSENSSFTEKPLHDTVTELSMPSELLYHLVLVNKNRKASFVNVHWNQADGGSHFEWYRKGVFNSEANYLLNYFNTEK
jgi:hypothetical protein